MAVVGHGAAKLSWTDSRAVLGVFQGCAGPYWRRPGFTQEVSWAAEALSGPARRLSGGLQGGTAGTPVTSGGL
eukprot:536824-Pyramimonas_sp.AAC.1